MSTFIPTIPLATDKLSKSQGQLKTNNQVLDDVFGIDHYTFSNGTSDKGFHTQVTNPKQVSAPSTAVDQAKIYGFEPHATIGTLQYSRGPSDATPTPLTNLHGNIASLQNSSSNIIDLASTPRSMGYLIMQWNNDTPTTSGSFQPFIWTGTTLRLVSGVTPTTIKFNASGTIIQIATVNSATYSNIYWVMHFDRCST